MSFLLCLPPLPFPPAGAHALARQDPEAGQHSRFGRALGATREREWPYGTAIRGYWPSPLTSEPWIESCLDVKDRNGNPMPGYGWIPAP